MKAVIATWYPENTGAPHGGVEAACVNLVEALCRRGLDVHVVTLDARVTAPRVVAEERHHVHRLPRGKAPLLPFATGAGGRMVRDYIAGLKPDVVHSHDTFGIMTRGLDLPRVFTIHGFIHEDTRTRGGVSSRLRAIYWKWHETRCWAEQPHIIAISPYVRERLRGIATGCIHDIENAVPRDCFETLRDEVPGTIFSAAVICRRKNTLGLIRALSRIGVPGVRLRLAGPVTEPDYGEQVKATIRSLRLEKSVDLLGRLSSNEIRKELTRASVFALVSFEEGAPMGIAEASAMGVPVITSNRCGMPYMVRHGEGGFLVDPNDAQAIARLLVRLLTNPALRSEMSTRARLHALNHFHPDAVAARTVEVYALARGDEQGDEHPLTRSGTLEQGHDGVLAGSNRVTFTRG